MPLPLLALAAMPLSAAVPMPARPCLRPGADRVEARQRVRIRPLGDMPPARQILAVYRSIDGCPTPIVVRAEVGRPRR